MHCVHKEDLLADAVLYKEEMLDSALRKHCQVKMSHL